MDVSQDLAEYAAKHTTSLLDRPEPAQVDLGLLAAFDNTPTDPEAYSAALNPHLLALTLASTSTLLSSLFALDTHSTPLGPVFRPPPPTTLLPREKPLPKPKPPTKWERFAKERGISHRKKERDVWDEERQEWVRRWGRGGKNKEGEEQWLHEVKAKDDADHDPAATARKERKARIAKNEAQHAANVAHAAARASSSSDASSSQAAKASAREQRKKELERGLLVSKTSTASLGRFDKKIEGEPKVKGVKRKFENNIAAGGWGEEKGKALDVLKSVESGERKKTKGTQQEEGGVSHRKAVRHLGREQRAEKKRGKR
ncbi:ribosome biogenesis-related protein [Papiliotrema laurentii]|uniref:Ribosome biogenesis regulatory protein n=1 Tax=Papiliotrema laurentii TaxID=5418 RepID=A0AAD9CTB7_PAPLA|nr:ribosome biogenesis-related protein [Papiliotrema laurentii]